MFKSVRHENAVIKKSIGIKAGKMLLILMLQFMKQIFSSALNNKPGDYLLRYMILEFMLYIIILLCVL